MRVTHLKNLKKDGNRPVLIEVYGGFGLDGRIDSTISKTELRFLSKGGIFAAPALRGGGESDGNWRQQAQLSGKHFTMDDLKASADWFTQGWSKSNLIITTGTSNGGLTVASAGLQFPTHFGLVIPIGGVHDLLHKEMLDPKFDEGWKSEYGDSRVDWSRPYLTLLSPVELARLGKMPNFLIISGQADSRVNPLHSDHLYQALKKEQPKDKFVKMIQLKNSGHWLASTSYQDIVAWRTNVAKWTTIFDYLEMDFEH